MIDFVAKVYQQLGHTSYHSNKAIATVHQLSPDTIKPHLSSSQYYGLLEIKHGVGYKVTDQFQRIFLPRNDNEKRSAIIESLKMPETFQQLFKDYEFHVVPFDGVKNHFIRSFGMKEDIAAKTAQIFIENLKEYQLLDNRGVLTSGMPSKPVIAEVTHAEEVKPDPVPPEDGSETPKDNRLPERKLVDRFIYQSELDANGKKSIPIHLIDGKQALFVYPDDISADDIELVKHQIDGILLRIKLESKKKQVNADES